MKYFVFILIAFVFACTHTVDSLSNVDVLKKYERLPKLELSEECKDTSAAVLFGKWAFNIPDQFSNVSCASCHNIENAGFSTKVADHGGGLINKIEVEVSEFLYDADWQLPVDEKPIKTPTLVNAAHKNNVFWSGKTIPFFLEAQVDSASHAHFQEAIHFQLRKDSRAWDFSERAFGKPYSFELLKCAIAAYEQTIITDQNDVNLALKGEKKALSRIDFYGEELFSENCYSCHYNNTRIPALASSPNFDTIAAPFLENVFDSPKPNFYSVKHSSFHNRELLSPKEILTRHSRKGVVRNLTQKEKNHILRFIKNLHDKNLKRYE